MKLFKLRNVFGLSFAVLLAACGAGNQVDAPTRAAAMLQTNVTQAASTAQAGSAQAGAQASGATRVAAANMPTPDCASDGCKGLRIIDANAEAFRYQAQQHAGAPQS